MSTGTVYSPWESVDENSGERYSPASKSAVSAPILPGPGDSFMDPDAHIPVNGKDRHSRGLLAICIILGVVFALVGGIAGELKGVLFGGAVGFLLPLWIAYGPMPDF